VHIFSSVDIETFLVLFVGYTVPDFAAEHHLVASHVVVHDVLKLWHQSFHIDKIKEYTLFCSNLNSDVSFDEIYKSSLIDCMILFPGVGFVSFILYLFEKQNATRASDDQGFSVEQNHLTNVHLSHSLESIFC